MSGPLVDVDTLVAGINYDIENTLRLGGDSLEFIEPDANDVSGWAIVRTLASGFSRPPGDTDVGTDAKQFTFEVAENIALVPSGIPTMEVVGRTKGLHIRFRGEIFPVSKVEAPEPTVAQVYTIYCNSRVLKANFKNR